MEVMTRAQKTCILFGHFPSEPNMIISSKDCCSLYGGIPLVNPL